MKRPALFLLALLHSTGPASAGRIPDCVKYIYLDVNNREGSTAPLMACSEVTRGKAHDCHEIGGLDFDRVKKAAQDVTNWTHVYYTAWGVTMGCYASVLTLPGLLPRGFSEQMSSEIRKDYQDALVRMAAAAERNSTDGTRPTGSFADRSRGEVVDTKVGDFCREFGKKHMAKIANIDPMAKAAANFAVDLAYNYWTVGDVQSEMQRGDLRAIARKYGKTTEIYKQKVRELNAKNWALKESQRKIFDRTVAAAKALYKFMRSPSDIPVGISSNVDKDALECMSPEEIAKVRGMVCKLVKATGVFESYKPGDKFFEGAAPNFLVDTSRAARTAKFIQENCEGGPALRGNKEVGKVNDPKAVLP